MAPTTCPAISKTKSNAWASKHHPPGVARKLAEKPDATRRFFAEHCACGAMLSEAGQKLAKEYDHIDIPPTRPITTRVELFHATC
jgi:transposase